MKTSVTWVFLLLFLVVAAIYFFLMPSVQFPGEETRQPASHVLQTDEKEDPVRWLQIQNPEKNLTISMEKQAGKWQLKYPVNDDADPRMVEGLLAALKLTQEARKLYPEKNWGEYGLLRPSIKVGVETESHKRRYLSLGDNSPVGPNVYARWDGEPQYFLVTSDLKSAFERSVYSLRRKEMFTTPINEVSKIHIRAPSGDYEMVKKEGKWVWTEPIPLLGRPLEKSQTDEVLTQVLQLYVKDFLDKEQPSLSKASLVTVNTFITVWGKDNAQETAQIGESLTARDGFYALRSGGGNIVLVAQTNLRQIFQTVETLAQK